MKPMLVVRAKRSIALLLLAACLLTGAAAGIRALHHVLPTPGKAQAEALLSHALPALFHEEKEPLSPSAKILAASLPALSFSADAPPTAAPTLPPPPEETIGETTLLTASENGYTAQHDIYINNNTDRSVDIPALLALSSNITAESGAPTVLIVHTHTSESYTPTAQMNYIPTDTDRTEDARFNVVRVGEELKAVLESYGIGVVHNTEINDYPSYNGAYQKTLGVIEAEMAKNPSISVVIDLHRDALTDSSGSKLKPVWEIGGEKAAQVMLVVGSDQTLEHPSWQENLSFALKYQTEMCNRYPGLARPLNLARHRYNAHVSPGAVILEVGASGNTLEEALRGVRYAGECLAQVILLETEKNT